ncbi:cuticle protein-like [Limulus polyphemus]|uniref:Cuticle protein-like n=1 Tax=Limulus polyphemus TaxID=6850 RepID=A0ABM1RVX3_LIMPO|nr:cuticle protein-like [Limulus polyphemus]
MVLRVIVFLSFVALGASFGTYVSSPLYYNLLPHAQYRPLAVSLSAPAPEAPAAVEEPSPFAFAYTAEGEGGFSSRAESEGTAGDVSGSYSFNIPDGRQRHVSYNAGTSGFTATVKSNEQGILAGENPADVQNLNYRCVILSMIIILLLKVSFSNQERALMGQQPEILMAMVRPSLELEKLTRREDRLTPTSSPLGFSDFRL